MKHTTMLALLAALPLAALAQDAVTTATPKGETATPKVKEPATVYFTHDISPDGLAKAYKALGRPLEGKKVVHTPF